MILFSAKKNRADIVLRTVFDHFSAKKNCAESDVGTVFDNSFEATGLDILHHWYTRAGNVCLGIALPWKLFASAATDPVKRKDLASFQIANGGERRHVMCVGARSGSNPGHLGSKASALNNCASCPLRTRYLRACK